MSDDKDVYICDECKDLFITKSRLDAHIREGHETKDVSAHMSDDED